jgi:hypothetical protein
VRVDHPNVGAALGEFEGDTEADEAGTDHHDHCAVECSARAATGPARAPQPSFATC